MEKPVRSKGGNKIFKYLPKATSFSIPNPPFSPGRDKRSENSKLKAAHNNRGFSGPILLIPAEARRKGNKSGRYDDPTSPKISCMGQIKHTKKSCCRSGRRASPPKPQRRPSFTIAKMFRRKVRPGRQPEMDMDGSRPQVVPAQAPPSLGQLKKFTSSRDSLVGFDWVAQRGVGDRLNHANCYMGEDTDEEDDIIIPHSAPMVIGGGGGGAAMEAKKEVNIWKRRTMAPPRPLQVN